MDLNNKIQVYGADWCSMTKSSLALLKRLNVDFDYIDIEAAGNDAAAAWVRQQNDGKERKPTIKVGDLILVEPSDSELEKAIKNNSPAKND